MGRGRVFWGIFAAAAAFGLLFETQAVVEGVRSGLQSCANLLIPSLFPFMILANFIAKTPAAAGLSRMVGVLVRPLGIPERLCAALLMSFVGGFPVGAQMLSGMLSRGEIDRKTAEMALCFCVNAGPSFLISAVGAGMLGSRGAGLCLLGAQLLSSLVIGAVVFHGRRLTAPANPLPPEPDAFVESVRGASAGMLGICAFVVAFSAISALLAATGILPMLAAALGALFPGLGEDFFAAALTGLLEVTGGCIAAAQVGGFQGYLLCAVLVSASSLSILFQVQSCFPGESGVRFGQLWRSRLWHSGLTALFAAIGWRFLPPIGLAVGAQFTRPVPQAAPNMFFTCACLIAMCSMLLCPKSSNGKMKGGNFR